MGFIRRAVLLIAPVLLLTIVACGGEDPSPSPTPTPEPTASPTQTPTAPPTPVPTPEPTPTPIATPVAVPTPTPWPVNSPIYTVPEGVQGGVLETISPAVFAHRDVHQTLQDALATLGPGLVYSRMLRVRTGRGCGAAFAGAGMRSV